MASRAVSLTFHSDDMSAEAPRAPLKCGFGEKKLTKTAQSLLAS